MCVNIHNIYILYVRIFGYIVMCSPFFFHSFVVQRVAEVSQVLNNVIVV